MSGQNRHIGLVIDSLGGYGDKILAGIGNYARRKPNWRIACFDHGLGELADLAESWQGDGIICTAVEAGCRDAALSRDIPVVNMSSRQMDPVFVNVVGDDLQAGIMAAEFLMARGFKSYAFIRGRDGGHFSQDRGKGFVRALRAGGFRVHTLTIGAAGDEEVMHWLGGLPRPVALLGSTDHLASMVLDACWKLGLRVPEEIAVLGIGNYHQLCELCSPPLSSVDIDMERCGFEAAQWLDRILEGEPRPADAILIPPSAVVERGSTDVHAFDDPHVVAALRFIQENAARTIHVAEVVAATGISRRSLEVRFNKLVGRTLHDEIWRAHHELAAGLLSSSDLPLHEVAGRSGFRTASALVNYFRKRHGVTPKEYRTANRR